MPDDRGLTVPRHRFTFNYMVEYQTTEQTTDLDTVFASLSDPIRRDILKRVSSEQLTVSEIASPYDVSLAAVSKHLGVLERAALITKRKRGKQHFIELSPQALREAMEYILYYRAYWESQLDALESYLNKEEAR